MDPGNWATDLAGGSKFGYTLLSVILISNLMAILLQHLCVKLGVATGRDLAQACRDHYPTPVVWGLWFLCELAIAACDLAEVIGSAIGLQLLFGIPLVWGCIITCLDVLAVLYLQNKGFRYIEALVLTLILTIGGCFVAELFFAKPSLTGVLMGFVPSTEILKNQEMLYVSIGILGATVMPHNLYLHSSIVQTRNFERTNEGKREAIKFATIDSTAALMFALFINGGILVLAAAAFHFNGHNEVAEIQDAFQLLSPTLGVGVASTLFAVALLASGQNATLTGTLAGQIVMEGFLNFRLKPWLRRLITRAIAIVPAVVVIGMYGESSTTSLLIASQVVLSMQLGFAVWPLMRFTGEKAKMGEFANPLWIKILGWSTAIIIIVLNLKLLFDTFVPESIRRPFYAFFGLSI
jgi:manganese transport protein